jgi:hypothetical protein
MHTGSCRGIDVVAISQWRVGGHGVTEDENQDSRNDVSPGQFPVRPQFDFQHEFNVVNESVKAVNPADADRLDDNHQINNKIASQCANNVHNNQATLYIQMKDSKMGLDDTLQAQTHTGVT